jgi:hypothetical protein
VPGAAALVLGHHAHIKALMLALFVDVMLLLFVPFLFFDRLADMHVMLRNINNADPRGARRRSPRLANTTTFISTWRISTRGIPAEGTA